MSENEIDRMCDELDHLNIDWPTLEDHMCDAVKALSKGQYYNVEDEEYSATVAARIWFAEKMISLASIDIFGDNDIGNIGTSSEDWKENEDWSTNKNYRGKKHMRIVRKVTLARINSNFSLWLLDAYDRGADLMFEDVTLATFKDSED